MRPLLDDGFQRLPVDEIATFTAASNLKSQAVMRRLEFWRDPTSDFDHPRLDGAHPLRRHVVFRLPREDWENQSAKTSRTEIIRIAREGVADGN